MEARRTCTSKARAASDPPVRPIAPLFPSHRFPKSSRGRMGLVRGSCRSTLTSGQPVSHSHLPAAHLPWLAWFGSHSKEPLRPLRFRKTVGPGDQRHPRPPGPTGRPFASGPYDSPVRSHRARCCGAPGRRPIGAVRPWGRAVASRGHAHRTVSAAGRGTVRGGEWYLASPRSYIRSRASHLPLQASFLRPPRPMAPMCARRPALRGEL